jgi:hypothetical protein
MESRREVEEEEISETPTSDEGEIPRGWRPSAGTLEAIAGKEAEFATIASEVREPSLEELSQKDSGSPASPPRDQPRDAQIVDEAKDAAKLEAGLNTLESTDAGVPIARAIRDHGTSIKFGATDDDAFAQFDPVTNEITIRDDQKDASPAVLAAHLAHEGTHVRWNTPDSVDQELDAFKAQSQVWDQLKGNEIDGQCDEVNKVIHQGEAEARRQIRKRYPNLPEY